MAPRDIVRRADAALGDLLERTARMHHERRLRRLGHAEAVDPAGDGLWAARAMASSRAGSSLEVLIDGAEALAAIDAAVLGARSHVHVAGWHVDPDFALRR